MAFARISLMLLLMVRDGPEPSGKACCGPPRRSWDSWRRSLPDRQDQGRPEPGGGKVLHTDRSAVQGRHLLHEVQPQAGALLPRVGALEGEEPLEDPLPRVLRNSRALIL